MDLVIATNGRIACLYDEAIDLKRLGRLFITRASHVEPNSRGRWIADLAPMNGPVLGPFSLRSEAIEAEREWLLTHTLQPKEAGA